MTELVDRRIFTENRIKTLREKLSEAEKLLKGKACIYATGSFGRGEASEKSDLDLFIVGLNDPNTGSLLKPLDEICVKADLIEATRALGIPEFDRDGQYLVHYPVKEFTGKLGKPDDDVTNTFTARLLLLLESQPLLGELAYEQITKEVIAAYWRDYEDHKNNFMPAFLANDILRMWRTFCVNYEARTKREPEDKKISGKIKNYGLKHSRLLTCYSALLYLLVIYKRNRTVSPSDAVTMIAMTPTIRLEWLRDQPEATVAATVVSELMSRYENFLQSTKNGKHELAKMFAEKDSAKKFMSDASEFGDRMYDALKLIGDGNRFHRLLVV